MNFSQLYTEVQGIVRRPDLQSRINSAILAATLKLHTADFYYKDIVESGITFSTPDFIQNFNPKNIFPRYRHMSYIRRWMYDATDVVNLGCPGKLFDPIELGNIKDAYGYDKTEVYYAAGDLIQIRGAAQVDYALVGAFNYPLVADENNYISWIADEYPWAIIHEAAKIIFGQIGLQEQASNATQEAQFWLAILKVNSDSMPQGN